MIEPINSRNTERAVPVDGVRGLRFTPEADSSVRDNRPNDRATPLVQGGPDLCRF